MGYLLVSINHTTADVAFRAAVAMSHDETQALFTQLQAECPNCRELVALSTCNRTELYVWNEGDDTLACAQAAIKTIARVKSVSTELVDARSTVCTNEQVPRHLVRTAAGFLSMMVGETQIFGQVKKAYALAIKQDTVGTHLHTLFQKSFQLAKEVRTMSGVGQDTVSLAAAVAKLCTHIFSTKSNHTLLFLGAGNTVRLTARHVCTLFRHSEYHFCNRTLSHAHALATQVAGIAHPLSDLAACVAQADIIICATGYSGTLVSSDMTKQALQAGKRLQLYIDLSVPTNIADDVADLEGVYHYNIDALSRVIDDNIQTRKAIANQFDKRLMDKVNTLYTALPSHPKQRLIRAYRARYGTSEANIDTTSKTLVHTISTLLHKTDNMQTLAHIARFILPDEPALEPE